MMIMVKVTSKEAPDMAERKYLVVVDMQKDFIDGALGTAEARAMVPEAVTFIRACIAEGFRPIATLDTHDENYLKTSEGRKLPVPHCIRGTEGWELDPAVREAMEPDARLLEKPTFGSVRLPGLIAEEIAPDDRLIIRVMGLCTDICVVSNTLLLKARLPEAEIGVKADCCAGVTPEKHRAALETMASCQIDIL